MVEKDGKQFFVTVTDEFIETRQLSKLVTGDRFEIGNWKFIKCAYSISVSNYTCALNVHFGIMQMTRSRDRTFLSVLCFIDNLHFDLIEMGGKTKKEGWQNG